MKKITIFAAASLQVLMITGNSNALQGVGRLSLEADYSAFRVQGDSINAYVEIHYNLNRSQLKFEPDENGYVALIDFTLALKDTSGAIVDTVSWRAGNRIEKLSSLENSGFYITDMVSELIPFGRYNVELSARNGDNSGRAMFSMEIPAFGDRRPEISTVEIAYEVEPDTSGIFYKNGLRVMPNPSHTFSRIEGPGYFYAEGYGLNVGRSADSVFYVAVEILNSDGDVIKRQPTLSYQKPGESAVIAGAFNIDSLEAGKYGLRVSLVDGDLSAYTLNNFTVVVPRDVARRDILQGILNEFPEATEITTEEDARKFREEVSYIATHSELELFDSLPLEGKSAFLSDFWARRDPDPATSENEFKIEYFKRFKYVTANFSQFKGARPGWRSDRGRVFLVYGEPTEIERFPPSLEGRAWERWWYHGMEGGVYFVFVDMEAAGDYTLVHSSKQDEIKDYNWENKIKFSWEQR